MGAIWTWLKDHWRLVAIGLGLLAGGVLLLAVPDSREWVLRLLDAELREVSAVQRVRQLEAEAGTKAALADVQKKYADKIAALDPAAKVRAAQLEDDPVELARLIERRTRKT